MGWAPGPSGHVLTGVVAPAGGIQIAADEQLGDTVEMELESAGLSDCTATATICYQEEAHDGTHRPRHQEGPTRVRGAGRR